MAPMTQLLQRLLPLQCPQTHPSLCESAADNDDNISALCLDDLLVSHRVCAQLDNHAAASSPELTEDHIELLLHSIQASAAAPAERALGHFAHRHLQRLNNWKDWLAAECLQLDRFLGLGMWCDD